MSLVVSEVYKATSTSSLMFAKCSERCQTGSYFLCTFISYSVEAFYAFHINDGNIIVYLLRQSTSIRHKCISALHYWLFDFGLSHVRPCFSHALAFLLQTQKWVFLNFTPLKKKILSQNEQMWRKNGHRSSCKLIQMKNGWGGSFELVKMN